MRLEDWGAWLRTAPLPDKLTVLLTGEVPEVTLSPAQQWDRYTTARAAYEQGTGTLEAMQGAVTPAVADIISRAEAEELAEQRRRVIRAQAQRDARRANRRRALTKPARMLMSGDPDDVGVIVFAGAALYFVIWVIVNVVLGGSLWPAPHVHVARPACSTGYCANWQDPPMVTRYTGPGVLTLEDDQGHDRRIEVATVIEKTNGPETELPIFYVDSKGNPGAWKGMFWFTPLP